MTSRPLILLTLFALVSCKGLGLGSLDTDEPSPPAGLSKLNTQTEEEKAKEDWFDSFYSGKHGWGWDSKTDKDPNCEFYGNCATSKHSSGLGW